MIPLDKLHRGGPVVKAAMPPGRCTDLDKQLGAALTRAVAAQAGSQDRRDAERDIVRLNRELNDEIGLEIVKAAHARPLKMGAAA